MSQQPQKEYCNLCGEMFVPTHGCFNPKSLLDHLTPPANKPGENERLKEELAALKAQNEALHSRLKEERRILRAQHEAEIAQLEANRIVDGDIKKSYLELIEQHEASNAQLSALLLEVQAECALNKRKLGKAVEQRNFYLQGRFLKKSNVEHARERDDAELEAIRD